MKLKTTLILLIVVLIYPNSSYSQQKQEVNYNGLKLVDCIQLALEHNENLAIARLQESIAETQVGETRAIGLPQASFQSGLNYNYEVQKAFLPNEILGNPEPGFTPVQFSPEYDGNAVFSVSQLLFDGSYFVGLQAAKTLRELRKKETSQTEIVVVEAVTKTYYLILITKERSTLVGSNIEQLRSTLEDTKALNENGFAEKIDVDRLSVNLNNLLTEKNKIERSLDYLDNLMKYQMGIDLDESIELSGDLSKVELNAEKYLTSEADFEYGNRTEYNILQTNQTLAELDLKNNKATHLPKFYANFNYGWNSGVNSTDALFDFRNNWLSFGAVGVSLRWNLFTGLARTNKMERNRIQIQQLELQKESMGNSIDLEIKEFKSDLMSSKESLTIQKENMDLANSVFNQAQIKYNEGVGTSLELLEAETARKEAQTNYYEALYNAIIAKINLEKALGILY